MHSLMVFMETLTGDDYAASSRDYDTWYLLADLPGCSDAGLGGLEPAFMI
jgi:hypothetical protein